VLTDNQNDVALNSDVEACHERHSALAGVPGLFMQPGMCRTVLVDHEDESRVRYCGKPFPSSSTKCGKF